MATKKVETKVKKTKVTKVEKAEVKSEVKLNPSVWDVPYNGDLVAQVIYVMRSNARQGNASAKRRSDVSGGGKKPWKQKGTGRARAGSIRSPLWYKGGVTFVPNFRNWARKINKKMRKLAVKVLLSDRVRNGNVEFVNIASKEKMTQTREMFASMLKGKNDLVVTSNEGVEMALRNIKTVNVVKPENLNAFTLTLAKNILVDNDSVNVIEKTLLNEK